MRHRSAKITPIAIVSIFGVALLAGPTLAQSPPSAAPSERPTPAPTLGIVEGTVKKVDPAAGKIEVASGPLGFLGKTLEVTPDTRIQVEGRPSSLAEIREGDTVKASYKAHGSQSLAQSLEVRPGKRPAEQLRPTPGGGAPPPRAQ